jgi:DNA-binding NtrC family response regulator
VAASEMHKGVPAISNELWTLLKMYSFPGNIRELRSMVFDAMSMHTGNTLSLNRFKSALGITNDITLQTSAQNNFENTQVRKINFPEQVPTLKELEDLLIEEVLNRTKGNQSLASTMLGITRQALGQRLKRRNP